MKISKETLLGIVDVKNAKNTGERKCTCNSWEKHWFKNSMEKNLGKCRNINCSNNANDGAHVQKTNDASENKYYIIPLRHECNTKGSDSEFKVPEKDLVEEEIKECCSILIKED